MPQIEAKNSGILEVPAGKNVNDLPQSHFEKLVDKIGYEKVIRALTNLEVWNKDKNKALSTWASGMADKLKKKFRPESIAKARIDIGKDDIDDAYMDVNYAISRDTNYTLKEFKKESMSTKQLLEAANRKYEMRWKVLAFNPDEDNKLVKEFKDFDCIDCAAAKKREYLEKNPTHIVEIISESKAQKNEAVTKDNIDKIVSILSNTISKASKSYSKAKLVTNYQATTGSKGAFLDKGLLFSGKDAYSKAVKVSEELQKAMKPYEFKEDIGGALPYMLLDKKHQVIIAFGSKLKGSSEAVVGFHVLKSNLRLLEANTAQKNEVDTNYTKQFVAIRDKLIAKVKNLSPVATTKDIKATSSKIADCLKFLVLARAEFSDGYSEELENYLNLALKAVQ